MASLTEMIGNSATRQQLVQDCTVVLEEEVASKSGVSGLAVKAGYKVVKGIKPGFVPGVIHDLLPEFAAALDPFQHQAATGGSNAERFLPAHAGRVADALLAITDAKAGKSKSGLVTGTYRKLRPTAKKHVEVALPRLGRLIDRYVGADAVPQAS